MLRVVFMPSAFDEFDAACEFYAPLRPGLSSRFRDAVRKKIRRIRSMPLLGGSIPGTPCRKIRVDGFPYRIIYRIHADAIWIIAVSHTSRDPEYWKACL